MPVVHADFYRLENPDETDEIGLEEYRQGPCSWPNGPKMPAASFTNPDAFLFAWKWRKRGDGPLSSRAGIG
jgi:hypothetical protein